MATDGRTRPGHDEPFAHPALFYSGEEDYLAGTLPFVREGLAAGDPVAVAVPDPNLELLRDALGPDATVVHMIDMRVAGLNPGRIIPGVLRAFADAHPGAGHVRIIGEPIWAGRSALEYPACVQHEALINMAFAGRSVSILCPYDLDGLDDAVLDDAKVTHPVLWESGKEATSQAYDPGDIISTYNRPFQPPRPDSGTVVGLEFEAGSLPRTRDVAIEQAAHHGMALGRISDVEIVVNELATNSVRHGGGSGTLRIWAEDGLFICEIADRGHVADPLTGRRPAGLGTKGGRGVLLANYLSDLLRLHTTPDGTSVRVHFTLP